LAGKSKPARRYRQFTDRRLEILRSAADAFTRSGFTRATMEEIADKVRMTKGNLYYYFPSKQDLIFFCQDESLGRLIDEAQTISKSDRPADEQLQAMIRCHAKTILQELPGSTAHTDFRSLPPPLLKKVIAKRDRYERAYRAVIERGIQSGVFRKCNVKTAVWAILGALNWSVQWFSPKGPITVNQLGNDFADLFIASLKKPSRTAGSVPAR
jgi:AcrR family transcriptional regulator